MFVPGITGSELEDARKGRVMWGRGWQLIFPRDGGRALALPVAPGLESTFEGGDVLHTIELLFVSRPIYGPLLEAMTAAGYVLGEPSLPTREATLYPFGYDWRRDPMATASELDALLERIAAARGDREVDLVCQSNAARICRWAVKYGGAPLEPGLDPRLRRERGYQVDRLVLIGASNGGAVRTLRELDRGRRYLPAGRRMTPETLASMPSLFGDLPNDADGLFVDSTGASVDVDLYDAVTWLVRRWSIFAGASQDRLDPPAHRRRFGSMEDQLQALQDALDRTRAANAALAAEAVGFGSTSIYQVLNLSRPTPSRIVIGRRGRLLFAGDERVDRDRDLHAVVSEPGDGHATASSQRALSAQERAALVETVEIPGSHFEVALAPALHEAVLRFLDRSP